MPTGTKPFKGIYANERVYLEGDKVVDVVLYGIKGISTPIAGYEGHLLQPALAERLVTKAQAALDDLESQSRAPTADARAIMKGWIKSLREKLGNALRVVGRQKMTRTDHEASERAARQRAESRDGRHTW